MVGWDLIRERLQGHQEDWTMENDDETESPDSHRLPVLDEGAGGLSEVLVLVDPQRNPAPSSLTKPIIARRAAPKHLAGKPSPVNRKEPVGDDAIS